MKEGEENKMRQKLLSLIMIVIGLVSIPLCDMDGTFALMVVPMSVYLFFTREKLVSIGGREASFLFTWNC